MTLTYPTLNGSSIKKIKQLLSVISESAPFTPDMKRLKRIVEIGDERTLKNYLKCLEDSGIITLQTKKGTRLGMLEKPEKIYLNNPNQIYAISGRGRENMGTIRETFFLNALSPIHNVSSPKKSDFCVDDMETGIGNKIPLWLFRFLY